MPQLGIIQDSTTRLCQRAPTSTACTAASPFRRTRTGGRRRDPAQADIPGLERPQPKTAARNGGKRGSQVTAIPLAAATHCISIMPRRCTMAHATSMTRNTTPHAPPHTIQVTESAASNPRMMMWASALALAAVAAAALPSTPGATHPQFDAWMVLHGKSYPPEEYVPTEVAVSVRPSTGPKMWWMHACPGCTQVSPCTLSPPTPAMQQSGWYSLYIHTGDLQVTAAGSCAVPL
jgi:hypothetical protein